MAIASRKPRTTAVYCNQWARIHITEIVRRYAEIEKIYLRAGDVTGTKDLEAQVVKLYKGVLEYEARAACQFNRNTAHRIARNIFEANSWDGIIESLKTSDTACANLMSIIDAKDQKQCRKHLAKVFKEQDQKINNLHETNRMIWSEQQKWRQTDEGRDCHQVLRTSDYVSKEDWLPKFKSRLRIYYE